MRILSDNVWGQFVSITGPQQQHGQKKHTTKAKKNKGQHAMQRPTCNAGPGTPIHCVMQPAWFSTFNGGRNVRKVSLEMPPALWLFQIGQPLGS